MWATSTDNLILHDLITLIILGESTSNEDPRYADFINLHHFIHPRSNILLSTGYSRGSIVK